MKLVDTHAHLDFPQFEGQLDQVLARAAAVGVEAFINVSADYRSASAGNELSSSLGNIYATVGLHPHVLTDEGLIDDPETLAAQLQGLKEIALSNRKIVAVGEIGLDFFRMPEERQEEIKASQKELFESQLKMARELGLPVVIHSREAEAETLAILESYKDLRFVFHCYAYGLETAKWLTGNGWSLSFTGNVTYPKNQNALETITGIGLESIMVETDAPYLSPQGKRGQVNEPANVLAVAEKIAEIKAMAVEEVALRTTENAFRFFGLAK